MLFVVASCKKKKGSRCWIFFSSDGPCFLPRAMYVALKTKKEKKIVLSWLPRFFWLVFCSFLGQVIRFFFFFESPRLSEIGLIHHKPNERITVFLVLWSQDATIFAQCGVHFARALANETFKWLVVACGLDQLGSLFAATVRTINFVSQDPSIWHCPSVRTSPKAVYLTLDVRTPRPVGRVYASRL